MSKIGVFICVLAVVHCSYAVTLDFHPKPPAGHDGEGSNLIWFKSVGKDEVAKYVTQTSNFLDKYKIFNRNYYNCNYNSILPEGKVCEIDVRQFNVCTAENYYAYHKSAPCIFLEIKDAYNWSPVTFDSSDKLPEDMPEDLKKHISNISSTNPKELNTVWVTCEGDTPADMEFIGPLGYFPMRGVPGYYFPVKQEKNTLNPLMAVQFMRPTRGIAISVTCKLWTKDIIANKSSHQGSVNFELLLE